MILLGLNWLIKQIDQNPTFLGVFCMKALFNISALVRPLRLLLAVCVCALLVFSSVTPAYSATSSSPTKGETKLLDIEKKSQDAVLDNPWSLKDTQEEANKGLNEIQGSADADKMKRPENSQGAESIEQKIQKTLEKAEGK